ncbi:MAG: LacI family DNA-binding transcriptional regulator [Cellulosilyticaceae bacterium]
MKAVSISDIASYLNLSRNTVSKVINHRGFVAEDTKRRIIKAAITLGYKKLDDQLVEDYGHEDVCEQGENTVDRTEVAKNIIVIATAPDVSIYWGQIIKGITQQLGQDHYNCFYHFLTLEQEREFQIPQTIINGDIEGLIVMNVYHKDTIHLISSLGIPTVYFDMPITYNYADVKGDVIVCESRSSIYQMTETMIRQGKHRFGFVGDITYCKSIYERWRGYVKALEAYALPIDMGQCLTHSPGHYYGENEVEDALDKVLASGRCPEAWVCANDVIAIRVMRYLASKGYQTPRDYMISGFDDLLESAFSEKILTSVHVSGEEIGMRLAEQIIWRLNHMERHFETIKIYGDIKYRASTRRKEIEKQ